MPFWAIFFANLRVRNVGYVIPGTSQGGFRYVLRTHGPMATRDLHPRVQQIHPDLCDDAVDRVIDGRHYGKRWKHRVRAAQSPLKRRGAIERVDGQWRLCSE